MYFCLLVAVLSYIVILRIGVTKVERGQTRFESSKYGVLIFRIWYLKLARILIKSHSLRNETHFFESRFCYPPYGRSGTLLNLTAGANFESVPEQESVPPLIIRMIRKFLKNNISINPHPLPLLNPIHPNSIAICCIPDTFFWPAMWPTVQGVQERPFKSRDSAAVSHPAGCLLPYYIAFLPPTQPTFTLNSGETIVCI